MKRLTYLFLGIAVLLFFSCRPQSIVEAETSSTLILVRHAEKASDTEDPDLTEEGYIRAKRLAEMLSKLKLAAVYSTDYKRTRLTAQPVADQQGVELSIYSPEEPAAFLQQLLEKHGGGETVLIVGHSNTVPEMLGLLDTTQVWPTIADTDYGNVFFARLAQMGVAEIMELRY
ncbi:MAG TPA: phosphoglycerate mutase family protein [Saprospiraceae bacterium]|nr:phosphoglycerate mutase family protein [Saprospiraceae bacterium]HMQ81350.1 phosphoglycerate mutase family protein [Saprospiraceae bacterium]